MATGLANMLLLLPPLSFLISISLNSSPAPPDDRPVRLQTCRNWKSKVLRSRHIFTAALTCCMETCFLFRGSYRQVPQLVTSYETKSPTAGSSSFAELCDLPSKTPVDVEVCLKSRWVRSVAPTATVTVPLSAGVTLGCGILDPSILLLFDGAALTHCPLSRGKIWSWIVWVGQVLCAREAVLHILVAEGNIKLGHLMVGYKLYL